MAMTPEGRVKKSIRALLDKLGAYYVMPVTNGFGKQGAPDFLVCLNGRFIGIEAKAGKGKTTTLQELNLLHIEKAGGLALVIYENDIPMLVERLTELKGE